WLSENPTEGVKLPRKCGGRRVKRIVLAPEQVSKMVGYLPEPYASLVLVLYTTGVRIGEACAIRHEDLDGCVLHIRRRLYEGEVDTVKTESSNRKLPIPETLATRLKSLSKEGWVFQVSNGSPVNPGNALRRFVLAAARKAEVIKEDDKLNWHSFRHSFTVQQRRQGTHPKVLSDLLGHGSTVNLAMDVYDHTSTEDMAVPLDQLLRNVMKSEVAA